MAPATVFEENFKQTRLNHAALLNRSGAKSHIPHCLHMGEGAIPGELVSNLAKNFSAAQSLAAMLFASMNRMASL
jgi:hypothetical protein